MISTSTTLENLTAGTSYQVRVRAVSDVGAGPYSDVGTQITHRGNHMTKPLTIMCRTSLLTGLQDFPNC